jgi:hypothetical protein
MSFAEPDLEGHQKEGWMFVFVNNLSWVVAEKRARRYANCVTVDTDFNRTNDLGSTTILLR